jgi:hypothetical protein
MPREARLLLLCDHPNVVKAVDLMESRDFYQLILVDHGW